MPQPTPRMTLVLGGARSGKSAYAEGLIEACPGPWLYLATAQACQMRLNFQEIYRSRTARGARKKLAQRCARVRRRAGEAGRLLAPTVKAADMVERRLEGILTRREGGLTTAFPEGLNSVFSAVKRKAPRLPLHKPYDRDALLRRRKTSHPHPLKVSKNLKFQRLSGHFPQESC